MIFSEFISENSGNYNCSLVITQKSPVLGCFAAGAWDLAPTGIWSPDRPVYSESLYWLSYPGRHELAYVVKPFRYVYELNPDDENRMFFFRNIGIYQHLYLMSQATAVAQWLRFCATNRKVTGSIEAGVTVFFIDIKSFRSHYGPGVDSASDRNEYQEYFLGVKAAGA